MADKGEMVAQRERLDVAEEEPDPPGLRPPALPTRALPGSEAKIKVMARRRECGELLHHPADLRLFQGRENVPDLDPLLGRLLESVRDGKWPSRKRK